VVGKDGAKVVVISSTELLSNEHTIEYTLKNIAKIPYSRKSGNLMRDITIGAIFLK
jgi:hypothetical protein